jgi:hypothetical protein
MRVAILVALTMLASVAATVAMTQQRIALIERRADAADAAAIEHRCATREVVELRCAREHVDDPRFAPGVVR